jgi:magnesium chelatase subunit I
MSKPKTIGELRRSGYVNVSVKDEIRNNLIARLRSKEDLFPGVVGYSDTVIPQIVNALLSKQNFILLGLRGQAKSRILRAISSLLNPEIPAIAGSEVHDDPLKPISAFGKEQIARKGDDTEIVWLTRDGRYVEKLATPDTTIADIIGDVDPIRAAKEGRTLSDEFTMSYGLLPRANRGIFAINELPDLAAKIQVGLFNILQEGDVQLKGFPVRLPLDVLMVFSANPEDYTARGKIITPLKDRIGSEIRTHYPTSIKEGIAITAQESWVNRPGSNVAISPAVWEIVEQIAFMARADRRVDKRSGVSQRLPISVMESVVSSAEQRALRNGESIVSPRVADIYAALPSISGKLELEYEGEQVGPERIASQLIKKACGRVFTAYYQGVDVKDIVEYFRSGKSVAVSELASEAEALKQFKSVNGLANALKNSAFEESGKESAVACELLLEGLHSMKKIARDEVRGVSAFRSERPVGQEVSDYDSSDEGQYN